MAGSVEERKELNRQRRLRSYGLTQEAFEALLKRSGGKCEGCRTPFIKTPHIDHDHESGEVRGLLCSGCNKALGMLRDDPKTLRRLARYISPV